jgi:hypothetical protein
MTSVGKEQFHENMTSNDHMLLKEVNKFITILCIFLDLHVWFTTADVHNTSLSGTEFHEIRRSENVPYGGMYQKVCLYFVYAMSDLAKTQHE